MSYPMVTILGLYDGIDDRIESDLGMISVILTNVYAPDYAVVYKFNGELRSDINISDLKGETVLVGKNEITIA